MKNSINKLSELADLFEYKVAQYTKLTPEQEKNPTPEQNQNRLIQYKLEGSLAQVKKNVMQFLSLKNESDMTLGVQYAPESQVAFVTVSFPNSLRNNIDARVAENRKSYPQFSLSAYIAQEVTRLNNVKAQVNNINYV